MAASRRARAAPEREGGRWSRRRAVPSVAHAYGLWLSGPGYLDATTVAGAGKGSSGLTQDPAVT